MHTDFILIFKNAAWTFVHGVEVGHSLNLWKSRLDHLEMSLEEHAEGGGIHVNRVHEKCLHSSVCQILAVRPPPHQRGLFLAAITHSPSVCSPVVPVEPSPAKSFKRLSLEFDNTTCVSVRLSPDFFPV